MTKFHSKVIGSLTSLQCLLSRSRIATHILLLEPIHRMVTYIRNNCFLQSSFILGATSSWILEPPFSSDVSWGVLEDVWPCSVALSNYSLRQTHQCSRREEAPGVSPIQGQPLAFLGYFLHGKGTLLPVLNLNLNFCVLDPAIHSSQSHCYCFS